MKNKLRLLIGGCAVLLVVAHINPVFANNHSPDTYWGFVRAAWEQRFAPTRELVKQQIEQLKRENADLKRRVAEAKQRQQQQQAQQWKAQKQKAKDLWKKVNTVPKGYSSWQEYHDKQRQEQMNNSR